MIRNIIQVQPKHILLVPDGNRRWAEERNLPVADGYLAGAKAASECSKFFFSRGISHMSIWLFSPKNWKREKRQILIILKTIEFYLQQLTPYFLENRIKVQHIGNRSNFKEVLPSLWELLSRIEKTTISYSDHHLNIAIDYGWDEEIIHIVNSLSQERLSDCHFSDLTQYSYLCGQPDIDLIVRTSGEKRLSGLFPFQTSLSELIFLDKHIPDITELDVKYILEEYEGRVIRNGG